MSYKTMTDNFREYQTLKFFRGKERNNAELQRLADAGLDFVYRMLLIAENELDLHVAFSKMVVWKWLAWSFLALAFSCLQRPILTFILLGLAVLSMFFSYLDKRFFQFVLRSHNLALGIVYIVIKQEHGISFR